MHGHVAPQPRLTREMTPRRAPSAAGDRVDIPDARPAGSAVVERRQHVRLERPGHQAHPEPGARRASRTRGPCPTAASASARAIAVAARAASARRRRRGHAGMPGGWPPGRSADRPASGGRTAYASNHSFAFTKPKSTHGASAGCHSRQSRATISRPRRPRHVVEHPPLDPHAPAGRQVERRAVVERDKARGQQRRRVRRHAHRRSGARSGTTSSDLACRGVAPQRAHR